jgi:hypothetical protein
MMKLSDLRAWLFELIAVVIPGAFALMIVTAASKISPFDPKAMVTRIQDICFPFGQQWLNAGFFFSVTFTIGHMVQQLSVYLLQQYGKSRKAPYRNCIDDIFGLPSVREYLLPEASGLQVDQLPLSNNDFFMMAYPDIAPKTKRDTFIAISAFCGSLAVVSLLFAVATALYCLRLFWSTDRLFWLPALTAVTLSCGTAVLWLDRCSFFHDLADRVVVNYFLGTVGGSVRAANATPSRRLGNPEKETEPDDGETEASGSDSPTDDKDSTEE